MQLAQEIENEREKLAHEAANPSAREKEEHLTSPLGPTQSIVSISDSKPDVAMESEAETDAVTVSAAAQMSEGLDKLDALPDAEVKPMAEMAVAAVQEGLTGEVKMED